LSDAFVDLLVDFIEGGFERVGAAAQGRNYGGQSRAEQPVVGTGEKEAGAEAEFGYAIPKAVGQSLDEAMQTQTAQLIGDCTLR